MADEHRVLIAQAIVAIDDPKATAGNVLDALHALSKERAMLVMDLTDPPTPVRYELAGLVGEGKDADEAARALGDEFRAPLVDLAARVDALAALKGRAAVAKLDPAFDAVEPAVDPIAVEAPAAVEEI